MGSRSLRGGRLHLPVVHHSHKRDDSQRRPGLPGAWRHSMIFTKGISQDLRLEQAAIFGAEMAHTNDAIQAAFLNAFSKEMVAVCGTEYATQMQCHAIAAHLSKDAKEVCETLCYKGDNA
jgi:hypothetical protein